jgi:hypothetical protein
MTSFTGTASRRLLPVGHALALLYLLAGIAAMWWLSPRVPYADGWRFLGHFLQAPFPHDILAPDNGHHEVLPNAVRVFELHAFAAQQWLQVGTGIALALATVLVFARGIRGVADARAKAAALLAVVLGLFWLGNIRALAHGNESVHAYCVTLFLAIGLRVLSKARTGRGGIVDAAIAAACGLAAAFSFGSGIACFVAFAALLLLQRAPWRQWSVLVAGLFVTLALLRLDGGTGASIAIAPLRQGDMLLRWLSGPFVYAAWPLLDPQIAAQLPVAAARVPAQAVAQAYEGAFGPVLLARWPQLLFGLAGLGWLAALVWRAWRDRGPVPALTGIGLACFAAAVGAMIATVRLDYFTTHPEQLLAPRYVVWSSLFWGGLLLATAAQARRPARALAATVLVAIALLPGQLWMARLGGNMQAVAEQTGLAAAVGVVGPELPLGETVFEDLAAALPPARAAGVAVFAWPETRWLGSKPEADALRLLEARGVEVTVVDNRLDDGRGRRVRFMLDDAPANRLLLIDDDGTARGLAMRDREDGRWIGWMRGTGSAAGAPDIVVAVVSKASAM